MYCSFRMFKQDKIMNYILENGLTKQSSRSGFFPRKYKAPTNNTNRILWRKCVYVYVILLQFI